jgi:Family of unknown function (DUF6644)
MTLLSFCQWLAETPLSLGIRESTWTYPIIESVHVLSLCIFAGLLLLWDLRLLGITLSRVAVSEVWARLIPWIAMGAVLMVVSGLLLFASDPVRFYGNIFFRIKAAGLFLRCSTPWHFISASSDDSSSGTCQPSPPVPPGLPVLSRSASGPRSSSPAASWPITGFHRFHNRDFTCVSRLRHTEVPRHETPEWSLCLSASVCRSSVMRFRT